jgi:hypothetical protein
LKHPVLSLADTSQSTLTYMLYPSLITFNLAKTIHFKASFLCCAAWLLADFGNHFPVLSTWFNVCTPIGRSQIGEDFSQFSESLLKNWAFQESQCLHFMVHNLYLFVLTPFCQLIVRVK